MNFELIGGGGQGSRLVAWGTFVVDSWYARDARFVVVEAVLGRFEVPIARRESVLCEKALFLKVCIICT